MVKVALMGAGGKMGCRITDNIKDHKEYQVAYVEVSPAGIERLKQRGLSVVSQDAAVSDADVVLLALPDILIGKISGEIISKMKKDAMVYGLDPAAAHAGVMPLREDLTYFVTHPCHPPLFHDETDPRAWTDWFGGSFAKQDIVCALYRGPEKDYARGEELAKVMFAPVRTPYRITIEQMAMLEPALVETFTLTLVDSMKQGLEEVVKMGVPRDAAMAFLMGHLRIEFAITFGMAGFPVSDGAKLAMERARDKIFRPGWKESIFDREKIRQSVAEITGSLSRP